MIVAGGLFSTVRAASPDGRPARMPERSERAVFSPIRQIHDLLRGARALFGRGFPPSCRDTGSAPSVRHVTFSALLTRASEGLRTSTPPENGRETVPEVRVPASLRPRRSWIPSGKLRRRPAVQFLGPRSGVQGRCERENGGIGGTKSPCLPATATCDFRSHNAAEVFRVRRCSHGCGSKGQGGPVDPLGLAPRESPLSAPTVP